MSEKKVGKRLLTWVLVLVMTLSLLPLNVLADEAASSDVKIGHYNENGNWTEGAPIQNLPMGVDSVNKTAEPTGTPNEYTVTLQVQMHTTTETQTSYAKAATVLVIDTSSSMGCQKLLHLENDNCPSRLKDAKAAAKSFLDSYKAGGDGRYVALVRFSTGATVAAGWQDVSTSDGYAAILNAIDGLSANGGTNLEQGLVNAQNLINDPTVSVIPAKHVVALTDGEPTLYGENGNHGSGSYCNEKTYKKTNAAAASLRNVARLHTISFGTSTENMVKDDIFGIPSDWWEFNVSEYLASYVASPDSAYSAGNAEDLNRVFGEISTEIISGLSSGTVHDSLPVGVTSSAIPTGTAGVNWDLKDFDKVEKTEGNTTTYTYTKTYTVKIDPTQIPEIQDGDYYPLNGPTTLTVKDSNQNDVTINFPIPAGKVTLQKYKVEYTWTNAPEGVTLPTGTTVTHSAPYTVDSTYSNSSTVEVKDAYGNVKGIYTFSGWNQTGEITITEDTIITGTWSYEEKYTVKYDLDGGTTTSDKTIFSDLTYNTDTPTIANPTKAGYTFAGWEPKVANKVTDNATYTAKWTRNYTPRPYTPPTVVIPDDDALGLNTTDHFAYIVGYGNGEVRPQNNITRAETMTLVNRVLNRQPETEDDLLPNMTVWTDNANPKAWYYLAVQEATNSHYYEFKTNSQYEKWTELRETCDWTQLEK